MPHRVLHLLSQRPAFTGSGVCLEAAVRAAGRAGWEQRVVVGTPHDDPHPSVGGLTPARIHPLRFGFGELDFPLPGMSDVMPYPTSRFSSLDRRQLRAYRDAWREHVGSVIASFKPDLIHSHHVWLLSSLVKDVAPDVPVVTHCHATGLRQMVLCPHLADEVRRGCSRNDRFLVLHSGHADALVGELEITPECIHVVGMGYQPGVFHTRGRSTTQNRLIYAGKYSRAKGLPQLLDAVERLAERRPGLVLHVAGDGAGPEAEALRRRMAEMAPRVVMHGQVDQETLAELMRASSVFVLPSFYEGLPLVLVEALACGCRLVCNDLTSLREGLGPQLDPVLDRVALPRLVGPDVPHADDLPEYVRALETTLDAALDQLALGDPAQSMPERLEPFTWDAVFRRIEGAWNDAIG
ncbi:MAG: glycosyltransferase family 4 protein [bacterium]|nr:glycosyltransferase family 4 protein [bacterium]